MTLRAFILSISAFIIVAIVGLFYFQTQKILGGAFQDLERVNLDTVTHTTESLIDTRKYSLTTYRSLLENNNSLSSVLLVATAHHRSEKIISRLEELQRSLKCDIVDFIPYGSSPIRYSDLQARVGNRNPKEASSWDVAPIAGNLALLSFSPVRHFGERIGTLVLGYYLNGLLAEEIERTTQAKVKFAAENSDTFSRAVTIDASARPPKIAAISIETDFIHELNRSTRSGITWLGIASLALVLLLIYLLLEFGFVRSFTELLGSILRVASDLDKGIVGETRAVRHPIKEVDHLGLSFAKFSGSLKSFKERIESQSRASAYAEVAEQVAHDLKSPLSALDMMLATENLIELPENRRNRIHACIQRIKDTIRVLSEKKKESQRAPEASAPAKSTKSKELLGSIFDNIIQEKRIQYRSLPQVQLVHHIAQRAHFAFVEINNNDLKRALSNLIDNAFQAISGAGKVEVSLEVEGVFAELVIQDSGRGISPELLPKLGTRGATFDKEGGSGLGLFWAKAVVEDAQGRIDITSQVGKGTKVKILLPLTAAPDWFLSSLRLTDGQTIVVIDDDPTIHEMWTQKMVPLGGRVHLVHLLSGDELDRWLKARPESETRKAFFLFDYDLSQDSHNGLEWIERLRLAERSVLVTSYYEKTEIRDFARKLGVKLIPKGISGFVPVEMVKGRVLPAPKELT